MLVTSRNESLLGAGSMIPNGMSSQAEDFIVW